jgi:hypothetical protein
VTQGRAPLRLPDFDPDELAGEGVPGLPSVPGLPDLSDLTKPG